MSFVDRIDPFSKKSLKKRKKVGGRLGIGRGGQAPEQLNQQEALVQLPPIHSLPISDQEELVLKKLRQCLVLFDFADTGCEEEETVAGRQVKTATLAELVQYVTTCGSVPERVFPLLVKTVAINIFRTLPPSENPQFDPDEDDPSLEASWPHLSLVYELLIRFLESSDVKPSAVRRVIDEKFIVRLLELFDSEDPRERDSLKTVLHKIYSKFLGLRPFIRRCIGNLFMGFVYETERFNGVAELLEILGSIVNGFAVPLKDEHRKLLMRVLMPLHKAPTLQLYHTHLVYCVIHFLEKDPQLTTPVLQALLKYWPKTCSQKEVLFLAELEEVMDTIEPAQFNNMLEPVFHQLALCFGSLHYQVVERALSLWSNEYLVSLIDENVDRVMPIVFPALFKTSAEHWSPNIRPMACNVLKSLMDADGTLFSMLTEVHRQERNTSTQTRARRQREHLWNRIEAVARRNREAT